MGRGGAAQGVSEGAADQLGSLVYRQQPASFQYVCPLQERFKENEEAMMVKNVGWTKLSNAHIARRRQKKVPWDYSPWSAAGGKAHGIHPECPISYPWPPRTLHQHEGKQC